MCSGGSDGKAVLYDGTTGEVKGCLGGDQSHSGGIYSVSCICACCFGGVTDYCCTGGLGSRQQAATDSLWR